VVVRSVRDIEAEYIGFLDSIFRRPRLEMERYGASPVEVAHQLASKPGFREAIASDIGEFQTWSRAFWQRNASGLREGVAASTGSKVHYGSGVLDAVTRPSFRAALLHFDTLLVVEPFSMLRGSCEPREEGSLARLFAAHALSVLALRSAVLDDEHLAVVVVPGPVSVDPGAEPEFLRTVAAEATVLWSYLFDERFTGIEGVQAFAHALRTVEDIEACVAAPFGHFVEAFRIDWRLPDAGPLRSVASGISAAGDIFLVHLVSALTANAAASHVASEYRAVCLVDQHVSWECIRGEGSLGQIANGTTSLAEGGTLGVRARAVVGTAPSLSAALAGREEHSCRGVRAAWRDALLAKRDVVASDENCQRVTEKLRRSAVGGSRSFSHALPIDLAVLQRGAPDETWLLFAPRQESSS